MFNCKPSALKFATYSDSELMASAMVALKNIFPDHRDTIERSLVAWLRTNWTADPYSQMCYTYLGNDATPEDPAEVMKPIDEKVYFAGEHTLF